LIAVSAPPGLIFSGLLDIVPDAAAASATLTLCLTVSDTVKEGAVLSLFFPLPALASVFFSFDSGATSGLRRIESGGTPPVGEASPFGGVVVVAAESPFSERADFFERNDATADLPGRGEVKNDAQ
jgi:hypothetical protein